MPTQFRMKGFVQNLRKRALAALVLGIPGIAHMRAGAADTGERETSYFAGYALFSGTAPMQVAITASIERPGKAPEVYQVHQLSMENHKGYLYTKIVHSDLMPEGARNEDAANMFFDNDEVKEQSLKTKAWTKYKCSEADFITYLNYCYTGRGIFLSLAQDAAKNPANYSKSEDGDTITYKPLVTDKDLPVETVSLRKGPTLRIAGFTFPADQGKSALYRLQYSYDAPSLIDKRIEQPPLITKQMPSPLKSRFMWP
jgi:hypothetical protein